MPIPTFYFPFMLDTVWHATLRISEKKNSHHQIKTVKIQRNVGVWINGKILFYITTKKRAKTKGRENKGPLNGLIDPAKLNAIHSNN